MQFAIKGVTGKELVHTVLYEKKIGSMTYLYCTQDGHGDAVCMLPKAILKKARIIK